MVFTRRNDEQSEVPRVECPSARIFRAIPNQSPE